MQRTVVEDPLELEADRLLAAAGFIRHKRGDRTCSACYTELQLERHRRREFSNNETRIALLTMAAEELGWLATTQFAELCKLGRLSDEESAILRNYLIGLETAEQIAEATRGRHTAQEIEELYEGIKARILMRLATCPWWGWWLVYWEEIHRT